MSPEILRLARHLELDQWGLRDAAEIATGRTLHLNPRLDTQEQAELLMFLQSLPHNNINSQKEVRK